MGRLWLLRSWTVQKWAEVGWRGKGGYLAVVSHLVSRGLSLPPPLTPPGVKPLLPSICLDVLLIVLLLLLKDKTRFVGISGHSVMP